MNLCLKLLLLHLLCLYSVHSSDSFRSGQKPCSKLDSEFSLPTSRGQRRGQPAHHPMLSTDYYLRDLWCLALSRPAYMASIIGAP
ncbi:hypothetical protein FB451DRAFT_624870 [Mycena latifolia]|nr:hypothetical protein FB451DRAFT_624870 [Mycena latifolia]